MRPFILTGRVVDTLGEPVPQLWVTVYDRDPVIDDLLGVVSTSEDGAFTLRFLESDFQQHLLERERSPDLSVIVWRHTDQGTERLFKRDYHEDLTDGGRRREVQLGELRLTGPSDELQGELDEQVVRGKHLRRLQTDESMVIWAIEQALPIVERATGWRDLAGQIEIEVVESFSQVTKVYSAYLNGTLDAMQAPRLAGFELTFDTIIDRISGWAIDSMAAGLYEPLTRQVLINRTLPLRTTLERFVVIIGHELAHLGQFTAHPELLEMLRETTPSWMSFQRILSSTYLGGFVPFRGDAAELLSLHPFFLIMSDLEGHATYIERDHLAAEFTNGSTPSSTQAEGLMGLLSKFVTVDQVMSIKLRQYTQGYARLVHEIVYDDTSEYNSTCSFERASVALRERELWPELLALFEFDITARPEMRARMSALLERHAEIFAPTHPRHDDLRYLYGVLLAGDTDTHEACYEHFAELLRDVRETFAHHVHYPHVLHMHYRVAVTLAQAGAKAHAWLLGYEPLLGDVEELKARCEDLGWFVEAALPARFKAHMNELATALRRPLSEELERWLGLDVT